MEWINDSEEVEIVGYCAQGKHHGEAQAAQRGRLLGLRKVGNVEGRQREQSYSMKPASPTLLLV